VRFGSKSSTLIIVWLILSTVLSFSPALDRPGAWFQSPISPVIPGATMPIPIKAPRLLTASFWTSLLPWIAVGLVVFGGMAWILNALLVRFESDDG